MAHKDPSGMDSPFCRLVPEAAGALHATLGG
jgi:hypothetical protein